MILGFIKWLRLCFLDKVSLCSQTWSWTNLPDSDPNYTLHTDLSNNFWYFIKLFNFSQRLQKHVGNYHDKWFPFFKENSLTCKILCEKLHLSFILQRGLLYCISELKMIELEEEMGKYLEVFFVFYTWHSIGMISHEITKSILEYMFKFNCLPYLMENHINIKNYFMLSMLNMY